MASGQSQVPRGHTFEPPKVLIAAPFPNGRWGGGLLPCLEVFNILNGARAPPWSSGPLFTSDHGGTTLPTTSPKNRLTSQEKEALNRLAQLGESRFDEEDFLVQGNTLILPQNMTLKQLDKWLHEKIQADEEQVAISRTFKYRPWDGAYCTWQVFKRVFGALGHKGTKGFWGPNPPQYITIHTGPNETEQVPWGIFKVPLLPNVEFICSSHQDDELGQLFMLYANTPRKNRAHVEGIFNLIQEELENSSIYRGKAFDGKDEPEFLDLTGVDPDKVIYSKEVTIQLEANIWSVMRYTDQLRQSNIPRKRAALLAGPYGTGKTLAGFLTAQVAIENGWTCVYVRPGRDDLNMALQTARLYQPAVVFAEDIDVEAEGGNVSQKTASRILDAFDGITAKGTEMMVVLTTNHPDRIHKAMLRPGRLDAVIEIEKLDTEGITKLIKVSLPAERLDPNIGWSKVAPAMDGMLPAFVKEVADRAFKYVLARNEGKINGWVITGDDLIHAANALRPQLDLMSGARERKELDPMTVQMREAAKLGVADAINPEASDGGSWILRREVVTEAEKH